jgi:hypothetical protein
MTRGGERKKRTEDPEKQVDGEKRKRGDKRKQRERGGVRYLLSLPSCWHHCITAAADIVESSHQFSHEFYYTYW